MNGQKTRQAVQRGPGGRGAAAPEHCDHPGHRFLPLERGFLRANCRGRAGGWGGHGEKGSYSGLWWLWLDESPGSPLPP